MPLLVDPLKDALKAAFALGSTPPPANAGTEVIVKAIVTAYDAYAKGALSCAPAGPSKVDKQGCEDDIIASATQEPPVVDVETAAEEWSLAFEKYWTGALFGPTGAVTTIGGTSALESALVGIWNGAAGAGGAITSPMVAEQMAVALDAFTKTVMVKDSALPAPPGTGCGPLAVA